MANKEIFEKEQDNEISIPKEKRKLETKSYDYSVDYIYNLMASSPAKIILEVPFQRNQIWGEDRCSQLIESLIMNVPIPPLYFSEEEDGNWLVLDGLQRLSAIKNFFENEFSLQKLEIIKELKKYKYKDLPPTAKNLLKDALLRINVIKKESHPDIKYDIFMRLNKGAVILNNQELRNCLYRGSFNNLLRSLVKDAQVLNVLNLRKPHERYLDAEFLLRHLAFSEFLKKDKEGGYYLDGYKGGLKSFMNDFMRDNQNIEEDKLSEFSKKVKATFEKVTAVFGQGGLLNPNTKSKQINKALADVILLSLEGKTLDVLQSRKKQIIKFKNDILKDETFIQAISRRTSDHTVIKTRFNMWFKGFEECL